VTFSVRSIFLFFFPVYNDQGVLMSDRNTDQIILITPNPTDTPPGGDGLIPKPLVDGGVAVGSNHCDDLLHPKAVEVGC
jgi:hypothetical protein